MQVREVDPADDAEFDRWFGVVDAAHRADRPGEAGWQRQELLAVAQATGGSATRTLLVAERDGRAVGAAGLDLPQRDNLQLAELSFLAVLPDERRRGAGSALLEAVLRTAAAAGRRDLLGSVEERPGQAGSPGRAFADRAGAVVGQVDVRRDLHLPVDPERLDALERECAPHAQGYRVRLWEERCPDDLVDDRALLSRRMSTDAPSGDLPREEEHWDAARVREGEDLLRAQGRTRLSAGAVHEASGRLVAFTDLCLPLAAPERGYQWDTLVLREHRGRRLGLLLKATNLRRVPGAWPDTRLVSTWNAQENAPMIAVNEALGCVVGATTTAYRLAVSA